MVLQLSPLSSLLTSDPQAEREEEHNTVSRINIIDLAGSERSKVADTSGERLKVSDAVNMCGKL